VYPSMRALYSPEKRSHDGSSSLIGDTVPGRRGLPVRSSDEQDSSETYECGFHWFLKVDSKLKVLQVPTKSAYWFRSRVRLLSADCLNSCPPSDQIRYTRTRQEVS
jgi:hypothetical protein